MSFWRMLNKEPEVNRTEDFINDAIKDLENETHGRIKAVFSKIEYRKVKNTSLDLDSFLKKHGALIPFWAKNSSEEITIEVEDEILQGKEDINLLHDLETYKFEIYNDKYRFRIFELVNSSAFPVQITVDEGISEELNMKSPSREILSNEDMQNFLRQVLSSQKVTNVLKQLEVLNMIEDDEKILSYLSENPASTLREISEGISWTINLTRDKLNELEEQGKIEVIDDEIKGKIFKVK